MSAQLARDDEEASTPAADTPGDPGASFGLTPIQHWFFEQDLAAPQHWNMSVYLRFDGAFDRDAFADALADVVAAHPMLRARFTRTDDQWRQRIGEWRRDDFVNRIATADERPALLAQWQTSLALDGSLLRVLALAEPDASATYVLFAAHHLVVDAVSWRIIFEELQHAYSRRRAGEAVSLPPEPVGFGQWQHQLTHLPEETLERWRAYWSDQEATADLDLPWRESANRYGDAMTTQCRLDATTTQRLIANAARAYGNNVQEVLLAALASSLVASSQERTLWVELEAHGRETLGVDLDLSRTVGWFTARYPMALRLLESNDAGQILRAVKDQLRAVPDRGLGYGVLRYLHGELREVPTAQVCFNYLGKLRTDPRANWTWCEEEHGPGRAPNNRRKHLLDVNAVLIEGELRIDWTWPNDALAREEIEALSERYLTALRELIDHLAQAAPRRTLSDLPLAGIEARELETLGERYPQLEDVYPLAPLQEGLLFHSLLNDDADPYINQMTVVLDGELDRGAFRAAWQRVIDRHTILRSGFVVQGLASARQVVCPRAILPVRIEDWADLEQADAELRLSELQAREHATGFDLTTPPLMRLALIQRAANQHWLVWTRHHLALDGWSSGLLLAEVLRIYADLRSGTQPDASPAPQFREYLHWLQTQDASAAHAFWCEELVGLDEPATLPESMQPESGYTTTRRELDAASALAWAQRHQLTANTVLQGALGLVLRRYYGRDDFVLGVTTAGRPAELPGVEHILGVFINSLPLRMRIQAERSLSDWLSHLQHRNAQMRTHGHVPLAEIQRLAALDSAALFDVLLVFENLPAPRATEIGLQVQELAHHAHSNYPLMLTVLPDGKRFRIEASFDRSRVDAWLVEQLLDDLAFVLAQLPSLASPQALPPLPSQSPAETPRLSLADDT
ncbi:hypothetical protein EBB59_13105, partial [Lysobacter pythonis]